MSFSTQSLSKDSATDVDTNLIVFDPRYADSDSSKFSVAGLSFPVAKILTISHQDGKSGEVRTVVRYDRTEVDTLLVPATASVYFNLIRPASTAFTNAMLIEMVNCLVDFLVEGGSNANVTKLLNREV